MEEKMDSSKIQSKNLSQLILEKLDKLKKILLKKEKPFLTIDEASEYIGLSKNTIYSYTSKNILKHYKLQGRKLYFRIQDLDNFILNEKNEILNAKESNKWLK